MIGRRLVDCSVNRSGGRIFGVFPLNLEEDSVFRMRQQSGKASPSRSPILKLEKRSISKEARIAGN